jgi:polar amino acid transport system substrate-binding protein
MGQLRRRPQAVLAVLALALGALAGCAPASTATGTSASPVLARIQSKGELVVGTAASMPPLNMTTKSGEIIGLDIDLARGMAEAMKVKLRLAPMPFASLLPALEAGQVDMVVSGMTMTPDRNMKFAFVGPYFISGKSFLAKTSTLSSDKGSAELNTPSMRLAALRGSTSQTFVEQIIPKATLVLTKDYDEAINLVLQDKVEAMIADFPACIFAVFRYPDKGLYALVTPLSYEPLGIALPGNDPLLMNWAQNWLRDQEATGSLERTRDRWFKNASWLGQLP